MSSIASHTRE
jgi:hypothetical protein